MINRGPYALADDYLHLQISLDKWFSLNVRQSERHLKKSWEEVPGRNFDVQYESGDLNDGTEDNTPLTSLPELSVRPEEFGVAGVALLSLKEMYRQASILLHKKDSVVEIPFKPHTLWLKATREGHTTLYFQKVGRSHARTVLVISLQKICVHSVAGAEKYNKLKNFLTWFKRSSHTLTSPVTVRQQLAKGPRNLERRVI